MSASPASSQVVANLPQPRNPHFAGRQRVLESLHQSLTASGTAGRVQAISGGGGVGKSQVALEYAYRHEDEYGLIWWLPADDPGTLAWHYAQLAERLGLALARAAGPEQVGGAVQRELKRRGDWLLIFDNALDREHVRPYLPEPSGHVLITSREVKWDGVARSILLGPLDRKESVEFLLRRTGRKEDSAAGTLAKALGDLPLALEQAAALIEQTGTSCRDYLNRFESHWAELLRAGPISGDYPNAVAMTWELASREVEQREPQTAALLKILGHLGSEEIPLSLLRKATAALPVPLNTTFGSQLGLTDALDMLRRFALLSVNDRAIFIHHCVAALTRQRLPEEQRNNWCAVALDMMQRTFRFDADAPAAMWRECGEALPHALAAAGHAEAARVTPDVNAKLLNNIGEYLHQVGQYEEARSVLQRALAQSDTAHGPEDPRRSAIANNLGRVFKRLGDIEQARGCFETAFVLDRTAYGEDHPHVAEAVNNYGTTLHATGDVGTALQQFEWALEICRNHYGPEHLKVGIVTNNIGYALANQGELDGAIDHFIRALAMAESSCGPDHALSAQIRTNLGAALRLQGQTDAARAELERAAGAGEAALGPDHPDYARILGHLGSLHMQRGELHSARSYFLRALEIDERALGQWNVIIVARLNDLGRCLKAMGDVDSSASCYQRSAEILRRCRGAAPRYELV